MDGSNYLVIRGTINAYCQPPSIMVVETIPYDLIELRRGITIPERRIVRPRLAFRGDEPRDFPCAVTIYPGWDMRFESSRICHACYARNRQYGSNLALSVNGRMLMAGETCTGCGRLILSYDQSKAPFFAYKRPANWR